MKQNIIAVVTFIAFIAGAWFAGYKLSDNRSPLVEYTPPQYGQTTYRQPSARSDNAPFPLQPSNASGKTTVAHNQTPSASSSPSMTLHTSSDTQLKSYGGGGGGQSATQASSGNSGSTYAIGSTSVINHHLPQQTTIKTAANELNTTDIITAADREYALKSAGENEDPGDPFKEPVGDIPIVLIIALAIATAWKKRRERNSFRY